MHIFHVTSQSLVMDGMWREKEERRIGDSSQIPATGEDRAAVPFMRPGRPKVGSRTCLSASCLWDTQVAVSSGGLGIGSTEDRARVGRGSSRPRART